MKIHNMMEDLVIAEINAICNTLEKDEKQGGMCICKQCKQDAACYVLNRIKPYYMVSHRGATRISQENTNQSRADLTSLVYEGIRRVSHNQRPYIDHEETNMGLSAETPVFNIPTIMGRVFNGLNFSPVTNVTVELFHNGKPAVMKDNNWQNPYSLITNTGGTFTFMPKPIVTEKTDTHEVFEFTIKIVSDEFAELTHVFSISVESELGSPSFSLTRTHKLPDLYLFPPGEEKAQLVISD
jgi:competence protein ComFB